MNEGSNQKETNLSFGGLLMRQWRVHLSEMLVLATSVVLTYLACEAAFSGFGLRYLPLRLHEHLPDEIRIFAQSSKAGVVPHHPVLLLGDSYAQGRGDWLHEADPSRNSPFASANVINTLSGKDVVSLGLGGSGSAEAMVAYPKQAYYYSERAWFLRLPTPELAVVYFYEGNDLLNNVRFLKWRFAENGLEGLDRANAVARLDRANAVEQLDRAIAAYPSRFLPAHEPDWRRHFPFYFFMKKLALMTLDVDTKHLKLKTKHLKLKTKHQKGTKQQKRLKQQKPAKTQRLAPTLVDIDGRPQELRGGLQSPGMEIDSADWGSAALVFERSLAYLRTLMPETPVLVVYIPSPLASYSLISSDVSFEGSEDLKPGFSPKERIPENSDKMCEMIRAATMSQGAGFLDLRPVIRAGTVHDVLHGPRDFEHFNRKGYEILGKAVAERLDSPLSVPPCMKLSHVSAETNAQRALPGGP